MEIYDKTHYVIHNIANDIPPFPRARRSCLRLESYPSLHRYTRVDVEKRRKRVICMIGDETVLARCLIHQLHFTYTHLVYSSVTMQRIQRTRLVFVVLVVACKW
jgi:hypothetical protein